MKPFLIFLIFSGLCASIFTSCRQRGCTNKNAINFNVTADEDDGTCIVCHTIETVIDSEKVYLKDKKFGSPHYNQLVALYTLIQKVQTPDDEVCGKENCRITLDVKNLINQKMYFSYNVSRYSGPLSLSYSNDITIDSSETIHVGLIELLNNPPFFNISLDSISVTAYEIIYF